MGDTMIQMQITPADGTPRDLDNDVSCIHDAGLGHFNFLPQVLATIYTFRFVCLWLGLGG